MFGDEFLVSEYLSNKSIECYIDYLLYIKLCSRFNESLIQESNLI